MGCERAAITGGLFGRQDRWPQMGWEGAKSQPSLMVAFWGPICSPPPWGLERTHRPFLQPSSLQGEPPAKEEKNGPRGKQPSLLESSESTEGHSRPLSGHDCEDTLSSPAKMLYVTRPGSNTPVTRRELQHNYFTRGRSSHVQRCAWGSGKTALRN